MDILYQDNRIFVCVKPSGVLSTDVPGGMPERIRAYLGDANACVRTVHRLDAAVAGVMVFARSRAAAELLSEQVRSHRFEKEYLAVLSGVPSEPCGTLRDHLCYDRAARKASVVSPDTAAAKEAVLDYRVLGEKDGFALVQIRLHTGRTHQIRVQFAARGLPLYADRKYGAPVEGETIALWSCCLRFTHPQTGLPVSFCRLPPDAEPWRRFSPILLKD